MAATREIDFLRSRLREAQFLHQAKDAQVEQFQAQAVTNAAIVARLESVITTLQRQLDVPVPMQEEPARELPLEVLPLQRLSLDEVEQVRPQGHPSEEQLLYGPPEGLATAGVDPLLL